TGEPPFSGAAPRTIMAKQVMETPRPIRGMRPEVPVAVERALDRALEKNPEQRFTSTAEFVSALVAADSSLAARGPTITRSIAVLPFVNASPDTDNEYLSDGITEELIDALAKISGLRVSSRTSVFALKGKPLDVRAVGALLGVSVVLEGTVRKAGEKLRITAQLTSTDDGRLLWSQRYDRKLIDVFTIQDEIAGTIVSTLRATMFADLAEHVPRRYTENIEAYGLYLKGRFAWNKRTQEGVAEAIEYFKQAIAEDPGYTPAYAGLGDSYALDVDYRSIPVAVETYRMLGTTLALQGNVVEAQVVFREALTLPGAGAYSKATLGWLLARSGKRAEAERLLREFEESHAQGYVSPVAFAILQIGLGNFAAALDWAERAFDERRGWLAYVNVNPMFDRLRNEPRFAAL